MNHEALLFLISTLTEQNLALQQRNAALAAELSSLKQPKPETKGKSNG